MLNQIVLLGRLTRDPELRRTGSGTAVTSFTLAVDRDYKDAGGERGVDFIECVAWRATAEFVAKYFTKGQLAAVSGRLQLRDWTDKEGAKRRTAEVVVASCYFAGSKPDKSAGPPQSFQPAAGPVNASPDDFSQLTGADDDFPF